MDCKRALVEANGDFDKAMDILKQQGLAQAEKKSARAVQQGLVEAYIHAGGRIGVLVEVNCETDFVARTDEFKSLAHDIAMQIAATAPLYLSPEDMPAEVAADGAEVCLLAQPFIREPSITVGELITSKIATLGENIKVRRFTRYVLGS
ncbi:MAG: elongation factor Ts [Chloroflexi bacterium]|nr:elongation factor Ts [Chloroflexota bacterium]